ncbi:MAG: 5,10-methylenetetrahydrofolate reductase [Firmicutes bacterium]|mgnify:CR=1 FL=1|nr:5,10-methylenetetrahydrofolate reductase [Bacillota bacterium]
MRGFRERLNAGEFVLTAELEPPKGTSLQRVIKYAKALRGKVDAINITDSPMANVRMSPIAVAHRLRQETGLDTVFHLTCRDRNVIGLQSELLGAAALGVRTILALTGDHPRQGDHPQAHAVFEVDAVGLVDIARRLNEGYDLAGNELKGKPEFYIGVAANPCAPDLEREVDRLAQKLERGAHFVQTQPIYEVEALARFLDKMQGLQVPVIAGVLPLKSHKMACHIRANIPGIHVPDWLERRMAQAGRAAGVQVARELLAQLPQVAQGAHIMPVGSASIVLEVLADSDAPAALAEPATIPLRAANMN